EDRRSRFFPRVHPSTTHPCDARNGFASPLPTQCRGPAKPFLPRVHPYTTHPCDAVEMASPVRYPRNVEDRRSRFFPCVHPSTTHPSPTRTKWLRQSTTPFLHKKAAHRFPLKK